VVGGDVGDDVGAVVGGPVGLAVGGPVARAPHVVPSPLHIPHSSATIFGIPPHEGAPGRIVGMEAVYLGYAALVQSPLAAPTFKPVAVIWTPSHKYP
jgi:hypothetical protein